MALVAVVLAIVAGVLVATTRSELIAQVDDRLVSAVPDPERDEPGEESFDLDRPPGAPADARERRSDLYEGVVRADGEVVTLFEPNVGDYGPPDVGSLDLAPGERLIFSTSSDGGDVSYRVLAQRSGDVTVVIGAPVDDVEATIRRLVLTVVFGALVILATLGVVTWWVVRLGIRPVNEMARSASRIADGDLDIRVPESSPSTESGRLSIALNRMLGTIVGALDERARSEERLRRFVADASHELRTPITTIRGYAELYRHGGLRDRAALDDAMRRTEQEAARMGRLVEDMLTLAKLDEARPMHQRPVDIGQLLRDAAADAAAVAPAREISVDAPVDPLLVAGDEDHLRQVIANVVGNALVHTDGDVPIELVARSHDDRVVVEVIDHGAGMSTEDAARVTERFFRADTSRSRASGGSGLGLAIVDASVSAHGGSVSIDSRPGRGTTVWISLPEDGAPGASAAPIDEDAAPVDSGI